MNDKRYLRGFTMTELLVIIAIIGILAAILLPGLARVREQGQRASCAVNLMQLGTAMHLYASEHNDMLPWSGGNGDAGCLLDVYRLYLPEYAIFICPSDQSHKKYRDRRTEHQQCLTVEWKEENSLRASYDYIGAYTTAPISIPPLPLGIPQLPVMWDVTILDLERSSRTYCPEIRQREGVSLVASHHQPLGGNVLWLDGSVSFLAMRAWADNNLPFIPAEGSLEIISWSD